MKTYCLLALLFLSQLLFAQDTLYQTNGNKKLITTIKISSGVLYYRNYPPTDSSTNLISLDIVKRIVYSNGVVFEPEASVLKSTAKPAKDLSYTHAFHFNAFDPILFHTITVGYEQFSKSGYYSLRVPFSMGMYQFNPKEENKSTTYSGDNPYYSAGKIFSTGMFFCFYPLGQGKFEPYFGFGIEGGKQKFWERDYSPSQSNPDTYAEGNGHFYGAQVLIGVTSTIGKRIILQNGFGFGLQKHIWEIHNSYYGTYNETNLQGTLRGQVSIGYLF